MCEKYNCPNNNGGGCSAATCTYAVWYSDSTGQTVPGQNRNGAVYGASPNAGVCAACALNAMCRSARAPKCFKAN